MFNLIKNLFAAPADYRSLVDAGAIIVDVRTVSEFNGGHIKGAINIPVDEISKKVTGLKQEGKPVITCCRSGARSGMAVSVLTKAGIEAYNGGAWNALQKQLV